MALERKIVLCDIDGTLIEKPDDGTVDFNNTDVNYINGVVEFINYLGLKYDIIFFTKRHVKYEKQTREIIDKVIKVNYELCMREIEVERGTSSAEYKWNTFCEKIQPLGSIMMYFEDDVSILDKFIENGIHVIDAGIFK